MDQVETFLREVYESAPHNRIQIKTIYADFGEWVTAAFGTMTWNTCPRYGFYTKLRSNTQYLYKRFNDGICLVGLKYRETDPTGPSSSSQPSSSTERRGVLKSRGPNKPRGSTKVRGSNNPRGSTKVRGPNKPRGASKSHMVSSQASELSQASEPAQPMEIIRTGIKRLRLD